MPPASAASPLRGKTRNSLIRSIRMQRAIAAGGSSSRRPWDRRPFGSAMTGRHHGKSQSRCRARARFARLIVIRCQHSHRLVSLACLANVRPQDHAQIPQPSGVLDLLQAHDWLGRECQITPRILTSQTSHNAGGETGYCKWRHRWHRHWRAAQEYGETPRPPAARRRA